MRPDDGIHTSVLYPLVIFRKDNRERAKKTITEEHGVLEQGTLRRK